MVLTFGYVVPCVHVFAWSTRVWTRNTLWILPSCGLEARTGDGAVTNSKTQIRMWRRVSPVWFMLPTGPWSIFHPGCYWSRLLFEEGSGKRTGEESETRCQWISRHKMRKYIKSCCPKYSLEHQMWINLLLKTVLNKWFIPVWLLFAETSLFGQNWASIPALATLWGYTHTKGAKSADV